ncbi:hypothetical protein BX600DRAFT_507913 [Xylariales sp. PMI_506]|nr:hypothetical protein BX600DRAFT_507913 [Xylariales sp. PMI_506]
MELPDTRPDSDAGPNSKAPAGPTRPIRRRNRMINSCLECRKRKLKCSKTVPACANCIKSGRECLYIGPKLDEASQMRLAEIKEKQGSLERQLERDVAKSVTAASSKSAVQQRILADDIEGAYDDEERDLEATPLVSLDLTYEDDASGADDMIDLGIQVGRMRMTERIGGLSRPRIAEELSTALSGQPQTPPGCPPPPGYGGADGTPNDFLLYSSSPGGDPAPGIDEMTDPSGSDLSLPSYLRPGVQYMAPTSGVFFGQVMEQPPFAAFMPHRVAADRLMSQYFMSVHPIAPCSHRPTLEKTYAALWEDCSAGFEPRSSVQSIVFAAMFSGAVSMEEDELCGYPKANWVASLKLGTETALSKANFLRTTKVETMQAFIMYMLPLCRDEVSRAHSVLVGSAVRMAECMGLHRDGEAYGLTPLETHVRRLIWHQLCFLDIRTCEAQGPKPVIRREDYDTKLPVNCGEEELTDAAAPPEPSERWTTSTLALIRFEINEMMRIIWLDRRKLENRRTTLTAVLTKIESFRRRMSEKYDHLLDVSEPLQRYAKCVMYLLTYRLHVMVLHPYHSNAAHPMPPRLSSLLITSGIMIVELAIQLETNPLFRHWSWYLGAYFQYQIALLLATEVYFRPASREADRIWACLDYVFGMDRRLPPEIKAPRLLSEIQRKTATYMHLRKMRGPTNTSRAFPSVNAVAGIVPAVTTSPPGSSPIPVGGPVCYPPDIQYPAYPPPVPSAHSSSAAQMARHKVKVDLHHQHHQHHLPPTLTTQAAAVRPPPLPPSSSSSSGVATSNATTESSSSAPASAISGAATLATMPQMVFAGVSDGQVLWSLPPAAQHESPEGNDASVVGPMPGIGAGGGGISSSMNGAGSLSSTPLATGASSAAGGHVSGGNIMDTIDWDAMYALFPNDPQTGSLSIPGYHDPDFAILDWGT